MTLSTCFEPKLITHGLFHINWIKYFYINNQYFVDFHDKKTKTFWLGGVNDAAESNSALIQLSQAPPLTMTPLSHNNDTAESDKF